MTRPLCRLVVGLLVFISLCPLISAAGPSGASTTYLNSSAGYINNSPSSLPAQAGNVTEVLITGISTTSSWQGYYGNVSGTIQLGDSAGNVFYNWSLISPQGEIYSSRNNSILWTSIQCFNYTANGTRGGSLGEPEGNTSLGGWNLSQLETYYNISSTDADGVDETFTYLGPGTHDAFYVGNLEFTEGECRSTRVFSDAGSGESDKFEEVLLYEPATTSVVFASLLEQDIFGFNNRSSDFEMLVLEDGHGADTLSTPYFFYVEIS